MKVYSRSQNHTAPEEAKNLWPIGLFPILEIQEAGSTTPKIMAESGHIISYLARKYDPQGKLKTANDEDHELVDYYLHFAEGSLQPHLVSILVNSIAVERAPWPASFLVNTIVSRMNSLYYGARLKTALKFLDSQLEKKGGGYFVGENLTAADIILDFPINDNVFGERFSTIGIDLDPRKELPNLYKWHQLITALPAHIRSNAKENTEIAKL